MKWIAFLLLFIGPFLQAQSFTIQGTLTNERNLGMAAATVMLYRSTDSLLAKTTLADTAGRFRIHATSAGRYYIYIQATGFQHYRSADFIVHADTVLPPVVLQVQAQQLATVQVAARAPLVEVAPDKTIFNVQASLASTGLSAFEVLRKAPGVVIDNQDNLIVEGKTGIKIYIDGKVSLLSGQDLVNYLKTLQSTDVEAVEIITQPSARYEAAGTAGILNIRLKKNKDYGTNGSLSAGYAIGWFSKYNAAASINHRTAKLNFFGSYSNNTGKNRGYLNLDRFQSGYEYDQRSFSISHDDAHNLRTGLYYKANSTSTFGVLLNGNFSHYNNNSISRTPITDLAAGKIEQVLDASGLTRNSNSNLGANLNYRFADKKKRELAMDADFGYYNANRNNLQPNVYTDYTNNTIISTNTFRMITPVDIQLLSFKADWGQPLGKTNFSAGIKTSLVKTNNTFNFYDVKAGSEQYNTSRSNRFDYTENINAAYVQLARSWKAWNVQAGLRAEQTVSDGQLLSKQVNENARVKRNYLNLFPSGGLTWQANKKNSLALTYSRRIERPDYRSLNPFEYNSDELSFSKGNPFLKPQYTQTVKLRHTFNYTLTTALTYSYTSDFFAQITDTLGANRNFISPQNIANQQVINFSISYPFSPTKWWSVYANLNAYRSSYTATNSKFVAITQNSLSFYGQNTFSLPAGLRLEVSGWFNSPSIWAGTYRTRSMGSLDLAMQKSFLKSALSVRMAVSDLLYTGNWKGTTQYGQLYIKGSGGYESRQLRVSLQYNFGRKTVKAAEERRSGAEDEKNRIRN